MSASQIFDYHWIDEERVAALEDIKAIPKQRTTKRQIDMTALGIDEIKKIDDLMIAFGKQYADFLQGFAQKAWWEYSSGNNYRKLRDAFVQEQAQAQGERRFQQEGAPDFLQKSSFCSHRNPTSSDDPTSWVS